MVKVQVNVAPEHAPPQPVHVEPGSGVAVRVKTVSCMNLVEQMLVLPELQEMPAGSLTTAPLPERPIEMLYSGLNVAVAVADEFSVTVQVRAVPWQGPSQPARILPEAGLAVSVTRVPPGTVAVQALGHLIAPGVPATCPLPATAAVSV